MKYLLDTNTCIRYINGRAPQIRTRMRSIQDTDIAISTITKAEMFAGSAKSEHPERALAIQEAFFVRFTTVPFDEESAKAYGKIRAALERAGTPIGPYDLQIAAIAVAHNLIIVTHNTKEFSRVSSLLIEDWEA